MLLSRCFIPTFLSTKSWCSFDNSVATYHIYVLLPCFIQMNVMNFNNGSALCLQCVLFVVNTTWHKSIGSKPIFSWLKCSHDVIFFTVSIANVSFKVALSITIRWSHHELIHGMQLWTKMLCIPWLSRCKLPYQCWTAAATLQIFGWCPCPELCFISISTPSGLDWQWFCLEVMHLRPTSIDPFHIAWSSQRSQRCLWVWCSVSRGLHPTWPSILRPFSRFSRIVVFYCEGENFSAVKSCSAFIINYRLPWWLIVTAWITCEYWPNLWWALSDMRGWRGSIVDTTWYWHPSGTHPTGLDLKLHISISRWWTQRCSGRTTMIIEEPCKGQQQQQQQQQQQLLRADELTLKPRPHYYQQHPHNHCHHDPHPHCHLFRHAIETLNANLTTLVVTSNVMMIMLHTK